MKGKKVFVLIQNSIYECDEDNRVEVYDSFEEAKKEFDRLVSNAKQEAKKDNWLIETDKNIEFCAYKDGEYVYYHTNIRIEKQEIK